MIKIIAHRGFSDREKENTMNAIFLALNTKYIDGVEIDVRLTKDNNLVVIHDNNINRTSDGIGFVKNMTYQELKRYNFGTIDNYQMIPKLIDVLSIYKNKKILIIEIKNNYKIDITLEIIYLLIKRYPKNNIYIGSFNKEIIIRLNQIAPTIKIGIFIINELQMNNIELPISFIGLHYSLIDKSLAKQLIEKNIIVMLWTIDDKDTLFYIKDLLGDYYSKMYIITNKPDYIYKIDNKL
jgi:glycerophosphoryl diester phosphodiesterase